MSPAEPVRRRENLAVGTLGELRIDVWVPATHIRVREILQEKAAGLVAEKGTGVPDDAWLNVYKRASHR